METSNGSSFGLEPDHQKFKWHNGNFVNKLKEHDAGIYRSHLF